jgi:hypothetical protein
MSFFVKTTDEEAKRLLGSRFDLYLKEDGDYDKDQGIFTSATLKFIKNRTQTQFIRDIGQSPYSAFSPNIITAHLLAKDGEEKAHNNCLKNDRMANRLGGEYLELLGWYGLATFNPSRALSYEQNMDGLRMIANRPIEQFELNQGHLLDAIFGCKDSQFADDYESFSSVFLMNVAYAYLKSMLLSNGSPIRPNMFGRKSVVEFVRPLGIVDGSFSMETLRDSEGALRTLCASRTSFSAPDQILHPLALALTCLPGQALVLQGEDPRKVFDLIKSRAAIALSYPLSNSADVETESLAIARQVFLPFPDLWAEMNINSIDYLGLPQDQRDDKQENSTLIHQFGTMRHADTPMAPGEVLQAVHRNLEFLGYTFGNEFYLRPAATPEAFTNYPLTLEQFSVLLETFLCSAEISHSKFIEDPQNLSKTDPLQLAAVVLKAISGTDAGTDNLVMLVSRHNPEAVDMVLEKLLESETSDKTFESLLQHHTPSPSIIKKLPRHLRGKILGSALGL